MVSTRQLRKRCQEVVNALDIPQPFDLAEFCARLEQQRGRVIQLVPITAPPGAPCGLWVAAKNTDYIFHDRGTSPLHRQQIVLHELGHPILGHRGQIWETSPIGLLLPDLEPAMVENMLGRVAYTSTQEFEAETFADLISVKLKKPTYQAPDPDLSPEAAEVVTRIERALGGTHAALRRENNNRGPREQGEG